ncbi:hypothetical protein CLF_112389 [Clonorchis sinensis]|uniref:DUF4817 domain-containing protein n=1 Tax=Clonorchis sinensis TaxID=79923 RepID=G7YMG3_CLOSI|nr:hypothetical protein CLF_112389 [Clonorchis sinensis]
MDVSMRIEIVKLYYPLSESATAALRGYKTKHGLIKDPFTVSTITRLIAKFESTGSVLDFPGKERKSLSDERAPIVQNTVEQLQSQSTMTSSSITQVSQLTGIPRASVYRIMRRHLHLYPYHFTLLQNLTEEDKEQLVTFANWLLDNEEIVPNILWSDEANFSADDIINKFGESQMPKSFLASILVMSSGPFSPCMTKKFAESPPNDIWTPVQRPLLCRVYIHLEVSGTRTPGFHVICKK